MPWSWFLNLCVLKANDWSPRRLVTKRPNKTGYIVPQTGQATTLAYQENMNYRAHQSLGWHVWQVSLTNHRWQSPGREVGAQPPIPGRHAVTARLRWNKKGQQAGNETFYRKELTKWRNWKRMLQICTKDDWQGKTWKASYNYETSIIPPTTT